MTKKIKSAQFANEFKHVFQCPVCKSSMEVVDFKSLVCRKNHSFDFAKQGYVNMLTRSVQSQYDKELFLARNQIIMESNLYSPLHEKLSEVIWKHSKESLMVLDAGCGEGSHLKRIFDTYENEALTGIGLDISKEGVRMAASKYGEMIWLVGDLANSPIADHSIDVMLNILSPANYMEFKRILIPNGLIIKVVPRTYYLHELRQAHYDKEEATNYRNDQTVTLFQQHFQLMDKIHLYYTKELTKTELSNLVQMSPLAWNSSKTERDLFINQDASKKITVDFDILVGMNSQA